MGGIKDFFAANPHIVPSIALMTMQPQPPTPTADTTRQIQQTAAAKLDIDQAQYGENQKRAYAAGMPVYGHLSEEDVAALPPDAKKDYDKWVAAKAYITPANRTGAMTTYLDSNNQPYKAYPGEERPGDRPYVPGLNRTVKPGSYEEYANGVHAKYGIGPGQPVPPELDKYIHDLWNWKQGQQTSSTSESTVDASGNRTAHNTVSHGTPPPKPPAGYQPYEEAKQGGGVQPPPTARAAGIEAPPKTTPRARSEGGLTPPPSHHTLTEVTRTQKVDTEKSNRYAKAQAAYDAAVKDARHALDAQKIDQAEFEKRQKQAFTELKQAHAGIEDWYNGQVHDIGGTTGADLKVTVQTPNGPQAYVFKTKREADAFKREAGLP
jgi:hypothetical protein